MTENETRLVGTEFEFSYFFAVHFYHETRPTYTHYQLAKFYEETLCATAPLFCSGNPPQISQDEVAPLLFSACPKHLQRGRNVGRVRPRTGRLAQQLGDEAQAPAHRLVASARAERRGEGGEGGGREWEEELQVGLPQVAQHQAK